MHARLYTAFNASTSSFQHLHCVTPVAIATGRNLASECVFLCNCVFLFVLLYIVISAYLVLVLRFEQG